MRLLIVYSFALVAIDICKVSAKPSAATLGCLQKLATGRKDLPPVHVCGCVGLSMAIKCVTAHCITAWTLSEAYIMLQIGTRVRRGFANTVTHRENS
jgi:hypothetical protein